MKKILFIIFNLFIFINIVKAEEWQEDFLEGNNVETEYRYKFYKELIKGEYVRKGIVTNYKYEDEENILYSEYSNYQNYCPKEEGYEVIYAIKYVYQKILPVQFIKISNLGAYDLDIANIEIIENKNNYLVAHDFYGCTKCVNDNYTINPGGSLIIGMEYSVSLEDLTFILEFFNDDSEINYELVYSAKERYSASDLIALIKSRKGITNYQYDDSFYLYPNYTSSYTGYDIATNDLIKVISQEDVCKVREVMTYRYNIIKDYYDDNYYKDVSELINLTNEEQMEYKKDLENYKIFYRYKENDKLDNEEIEFINKEVNLVKTGIENNEVNYKYLIIFILSLILVSLIFLKIYKNNVERK